MEAKPVTGHQGLGEGGVGSSRFRARSSVWDNDKVPEMSAGDGRTTQQNTQTHRNAHFTDRDFLVCEYFSFRTGTVNLF